MYVASVSQNPKKKMYVVSLLSCVTIDNDQKVTILSAAVQFELRISSLMSFITSLLLLYILDSLVFLGLRYRLSYCNSMRDSFQC